MEEVINKPDNQFKDILNDLVDYTKDSEEKSALIEEVCRSKHSAASKPAASLNSSIYSSAASSSSTSSTSSASDSSSTNSASSSSTSSTLSSPSQSNSSSQTSNKTNVNENNNSNNNKRSNQQLLMDNDFDKLEVAKMEDLGKTARILEHRIAHSSQAHRSAAAATNVNGIIAVSLHSDRRSTTNNNLQQNNNYVPQTTSASLTSQLPSHKITLQQQNQLKTNPTQHIISDSANFMNNGANNNTSDTTTNNTVSSWKTISGKRDKRRKKPAEQPVLSQHIPGHKGEHEVDWLVKYIEVRFAA